MNRELSAIDILSVFGFMISLMNYEETIDQSTMQDTIQNAVEDIHSHLREQDKRIDLILEKIGGNVV